MKVAARDGKFYVVERTASVGGFDVLLDGAIVGGFYLEPGASSEDAYVFSSKVASEELIAEIASEYWEAELRERAG